MFKKLLIAGCLCASLFADEIKDYENEGDCFADGFNVEICKSVYYFIHVNNVIDRIEMAAKIQDIEKRKKVGESLIKNGEYNIKRFCETYKKLNKKDKDSATNIIKEYNDMTMDINAVLKECPN